MKIVNVFNRDLKEQLERKGFELVGNLGDGVDKPIQYSMIGDERKLSNREKPYVKILGKLEKHKDHLYIPKIKGGQYA